MILLGNFNLFIIFPLDFIFAHIYINYSKNITAMQEETKKIRREPSF